MSTTEKPLKSASPKKKKSNPQEVIVDPAAIAMLTKTSADGCETTIDRVLTMDMADRVRPGIA